MNKADYFSMYSCPKCGWEDTDFDGTYYRVENGEQIFDLCCHDLEETNNILPDEYYPKYTNITQYNNMDGYGTDWDETWLCPHCGEVFSFSNGT